jgi:hypothetical protein
MLNMNSTLHGWLIVYHEHPEIGKAIAKVFSEKLPSLRVIAASRSEDILHLTSQDCSVVV